MGNTERKRDREERGAGTRSLGVLRLASCQDDGGFIVHRCTYSVPLLLLRYMYVREDVR